MSLNKVMLIARLGKDPEIRYTKGGDAVANFSAATDESYKDRQGARQSKTEWHNVTVFGKLADFAKNYLKKGQECYIEGKLETSKWTDKQNVDHYQTKVIAQAIRFVGPNTLKEKPPEGNAPKQESMAEQYGNDDPSDIPF